MSQTTVNLILVILVALAFLIIVIAALIRRPRSEWQSAAKAHRQTLRANEPLPKGRGRSRRISLDLMWQLQSEEGSAYMGAPKLPDRETVRSRISPATPEQLTEAAAQEVWLAQPSLAHQDFHQDLNQDFRQNVGFRPLSLSVEEQPVTPGLWGEAEYAEFDGYVPDGEAEPATGFDSEAHEPESLVHPGLGGAEPFTYQVSDGQAAEGTAASTVETSPPEGDVSAEDISPTEEPPAAESPPLEGSLSTVEERASDVELALPSESPAETDPADADDPRDDETKQSSDGPIRPIIVGHRELTEDKQAAEPVGNADETPAPNSELEGGGGSSLATADQPEEPKIVE